MLAYSAAGTFVILKLLALVMPLRISGRVEGVGLDVTEHGEEAYTAGDGAILVSPKDSLIGQRTVKVLPAHGGGGL